MKRIFLFLSAVAVTVGLALGLSACQSKESPNTIKVGTIAGPETDLMKVAKEVMKKQYGINLKIVTFTDYTMPNVALNDGSIDANMFQHVPYLENQIKHRGFKLVPIGKVFVYPMGLYSDKINQLSDLKNGAKVGIPNDPSNESRALLLLQKAGLITLKPGVGTDATPMDIASNPKNLKFVELSAAQLPRSLSDVAVAAINTNYAVPAGLSPSKNALYTEGPDSPYANVVVVRAADKNNPKLKDLVAALHSPQVLAKAKQLFGDDAIPAWK